MVGLLGSDGREVTGNGGGGSTVGHPGDVTVGGGGGTGDLSGSALELGGAELVADHSGVDVAGGKSDRGGHAEIDVDHDGGGAGPAGDLESGGGGEASGSSGSAASDGAGGDLGDGIRESGLSEGSVDTLVLSGGGAANSLGLAEEDLPIAGEETSGASSPNSGGVGDVSGLVLDLRGADHDLGRVSVGGSRGGSNAPVTVGTSRLGVGSDGRRSGTISDTGEGNSGRSLAIVSGTSILGSGVEGRGGPNVIPIIDTEADSVVRGSGSAEGARGSGDLAGGVGDGETDSVGNAGGRTAGITSGRKGRSEVDGSVLPAEGKRTSGSACSELLKRGDGRAGHGRGVEGAGTGSEEGKREGFHSKIE